MSSRPKTQDSQLKLKTPLTSGDLRHSFNSSPKKEEKTVSEISMKDFLDFLKISYQISETIENNSSDIADKIKVDWKKLTTDELVKRLKADQEVQSRGKVDKESNDSLENSKEKSIEEEFPTENRNLDEAATNENSTPNNRSENSSEHNTSRKITTDEPAPLQRQGSTMSLDRKTLVENGKKNNWNKKKSYSYRNEGSGESETSVSFEGSEDRVPAKLLKKKLNEILQEGILDSVLPYLLPKQQSQENSQIATRKINSNELKRQGNIEKVEKLSCAPNKDKGDIKRKSNSKHDLFKNDRKDIDVVIHVCDEIKNLKRDFKCSQKLLVSQMGYFAEVTTGQKLEDMDISVHCDVAIFDWLMRWVQKDNFSQDHWPVLDPSVAIPVLMSSAFLQMESLQQHCLQYCKTHINDIIKESPNLSCINDNVLTRLANLFSNEEIEKICDKKDKIQSKLFCKLIMSLAEPEPQPQRGHFSSVATMYRCSRCLKLILRNMSGSILCVPSNMIMDRNGVMHSTHFYDSSWTLTEYIRDLKIDLKSWRRVYWRLWGDCHLLYCNACEESFYIHQMNWCKYHPDAIQYFSLENQRSLSYPIGRYSCCGERAYRFEVVKKISGCQYRDHSVNPKSTYEVEVLRIWSLFGDVIKCDTPIQIPTEIVRFGRTIHGEIKSPKKEGFWWEGMEITPKQSTGLFAKIWDAIAKKEDYKIGSKAAENRMQKSPVTKLISHSQSNTQQDASSFSDSSDESSTSSNAGNSEESYHSSAKLVPSSKSSTSWHYFASARRDMRTEKKKKKKKKKKRSVGLKQDGNRFWLSKLSTRCNQDNQRDFEERILKQIELLLAKKLSGESYRTGGCRNLYQNTPFGGIYVKLEQDWREAHCYSHGCPGSSMKARGSASFVNVNNASIALTKRSKSKGHR